MNQVGPDQMEFAEANFGVEVSERVFRRGFRLRRRSRADQQRTGQYQRTQHGFQRHCSHPFQIQKSVCQAGKHATAISIKLPRILQVVHEKI